MSDFRRVTESLSISPQVDPADMARAAAEGFVLVINNRPDGEDPSQPSSATVEAVRAAIEAAGGPVLAFCRSGTRSIVTWSIGQALSGADRETLVAQGNAAGYDLSGVLPA